MMANELNTEHNNQGFSSNSQKTVFTLKMGSCKKMHISGFLLKFLKVKCHINMNTTILSCRLLTELTYLRV